MNEALVGLAAASVLHEVDIMTVEGIQKIANIIIANSIICVIVGVIYMILNYVFAKKNTKVTIFLTIIGSLVLIANIVYFITLFFI